jgi:hypothetical protein
MLFFKTRNPRFVFKYHDGTRDRYADPVAIMRAMTSHPTLDLEQNLAEFQSEDSKLRNEASLVLVESTREIFGLHPFSEEHPNGLTELETLDILNAFIEYTETLKKNGSGQPT